MSDERKKDGPESEPEALVAWISTALDVGAVETIKRMQARLSRLEEANIGKEAFNKIRHWAVYSGNVPASPQGERGCKHCGSYLHYDDQCDAPASPQESREDGILPSGHHAQCLSVLGDGLCDCRIAERGARESETELLQRAWETLRLIADYSDYTGAERAFRQVKQMARATADLVDRERNSLRAAGEGGAARRLMDSMNVLSNEELDVWKNALDKAQREGTILPPGSNVLIYMAKAALESAPPPQQGGMPEEPEFVQKYFHMAMQWSDDPVQQKNAMQLSALLDYISELRTYAQSLRADNAHVRQANANYREENRLAIERAEAAESSLAGMRKLINDCRELLEMWPSGEMGESSAARMAVAIDAALSAQEGK